jgi:PST family polysaccharide transporter
LSGTDTRTILINFFSLGVIQGTNFILPLILLPYLIKTVGLHNFGLISFAQALMSYFIIFTDYGFNLTSTREIAFVKTEKGTLGEIVCTTLITKLILCCVAFILLALAVTFITHFTLNSRLYYLSFFLVLGQVLIPTWFFQGMEKMKYLTYINLIAKIIFTILIFVFIKKQSDYIYVTVLYSLGNVVSGMFALWLIFSKFGIPISVPRSFNFISELKKGWYVFLSNFSINAYINSNLVILGFYGSVQVVGYYSIADKIIYALRQVLNIFFQATYPQACRQALLGVTQLKVFFRKYFPLFAIAIFLVSAFCFIFAARVTTIITGKDLPEVSFLIRLLSFVPFIICLNIPAYQTLLAFDFKKSYMAILTSGSVLNVVLNILLAKHYFSTGTVMAVIITELYITVGLYLVLHANHKKFSFFTFETES